MRITIRPAQGTDAPAVVRIIREMAAEDRESGPVTEAYVAQHMSAPESGLLLAEADGPLRYSFRPGLFHAAPSCLIEALAVRKDSRGRGIGGALLEFLLGRAHMDARKYPFRQCPSLRGRSGFTGGTG
jgi:GNAT superfamily N-acetyltransferase